MTGDFCCCPGCGPCAAHVEAPKLKERIATLEKERDEARNVARGLAEQMQEFVKETTGKMSSDR